MKTAANTLSRFVALTLAIVGTSPVFGQFEEPNRLPPTSSLNPRNSTFNENAVTSPFAVPSEAGPLSAPLDRTSGFNAATPANGNSKQQAQALLLKARLELARRNTRGAAEIVGQVRQSGTQFTLLEDSPAKVEAILRQASQFSAGPQPGQEQTFAKNYAQFLMDQAEALLQYKQFEAAKKLAGSAQRMGAQFSQFERTPDKLLAEIASQQQPTGQYNPASTNVRQASYDQSPERFPVRRGGYTPSNDPTRNAPASYPSGDSPSAGANKGIQLYQQGLGALEQRDTDRAIEFFKQAWTHRSQLDPRTQQDLQDKLNLLRPTNTEPILRARPNSLEAISAEQQIVRQRLQRQVFSERDAAERMQATDPRGGLRRLQELRTHVATSQLDSAAKKQMLTVVERSITDMERYIEQNQAQIDSDEVNRQRLAQIDSRRLRTINVQDELAQLVDQFNDLMRDNRIPEAEVVARQAIELDPRNPVVETIKWKITFAKRLLDQQRIRETAEIESYGIYESTIEAGTPFDDRRPIRFPDIQEWEKLSDRRSQRDARATQRLSPEELRIQQAIHEGKVKVEFTNRPLSAVLDLLAHQAGVNIHLDQQGLIAEGVSSDTPVTINLNHPISLKSALNLILEDLNLGYVIQNEVVRVSSRELQKEDVFPATYYVADLVIPIPNFVPSYNIGLPGAIAQSYAMLGYGGHNLPASGSMPLTVGANIDATNPVSNNPQVLANLNQDSLMGDARSQNSHPIGPGGGLGGAPQADFDSLIELITTTIAPESWDEVGGPGSVSGFETNLSLVVSQTQEVHEQLSDLLQQLRRLQDLQVTIEVRFVTVSDNFFERIGVDFDFDIDDNSGFVGDGAGAFNGAQPFDDAGPSVTIGIGAGGQPTADLDLQFSQGSFAAALPQFGGFDVNTAASFGFAILSDIEAFFFITAAQGDDRANVMEAPKVTLFNGQSAFISDTSQRPFVTSVIPVVGDFAAAHQPVVVVLSEGTSLSVQAVVSADKRFIRLTLVPFFSQIGAVDTFTFDGKQTTRSGNFITDPSTGGLIPDPDEFEVVTEGTTVQLPEFIFTTVTTTVSVPDGGTVLLGGIKRLSEGRTEAGVPLLSKVPYVNRLFKNVGIGRETESLMMMVTPRIIIQEEEEENAVGRVLN